MFKFRFSRFIVSLAALALLIPLAGFSRPEQSQPPTSADPENYRISVDVGMVVLPVIVTNRKGKAVSGLDENNFHVFEDGRPQEITFFAAEDVPVTVGLVIDESGSMRSKRPEVIAAAEEFARSSNPQDQMFVVNFNQTISMGLPNNVPFTSNIQDLLAAISRSPAAGNTALYDGVGQALAHLKAGTGSRKALIVISDGGDNASSLSFQSLLHRAEASNAQIYTVGIFDQSFAGDDSAVLKRLARVTGGKAYLPQSPSQIPGICQQIARELRNQYTLGYRPSKPNSGGSYHAIRVTAAARGDGRLRVSTRAGYMMPSEPPQSTPPLSKASL
jgi:Ca-activated chloride channel family protein